MKTTPWSEIKDSVLGKIGTEKRDLFEKEFKEELEKTYKYYQKYIYKYFFSKKRKRLIKGTIVYKKIQERSIFIEYYQNKYINLHE